jgi:DNA-binding NarL/FixJ family response regulator
MIRLFIIEDHPVIIFGLQNIFRSTGDGIEVVDSAASVTEAESKANVGGFDLIILDLWIAKDDPEVNITRLKTKFPGKPIVIYTTEESGFWQRKVFSLGVSGYIFKSADPTEIRLTIEKVARGGISFPGVTSPSDRSNLEGGIISGQNSITSLQRELIRMVYTGIKQKEIARQKKISVSTIEKTLSGLREKFSAHNNADLIRILLEKGLL